MLTKLVSLVPLILALVYAVSPSAPHALASAIPIALAVLGAVWTVSTAILPHLDPAGRAYALLREFGTDAKAFGDALGNWKPPVPPVSIFVLIAAGWLAGNALGCAWFKANVAPIIEPIAQKFEQCVESKAAELGIDLVTGNEADILSVVTFCGGSAVDVPVVKAGAERRALLAKRASVAPCSSASAK